MAQELPNSHKDLHHFSTIWQTYWFQIEYTSREELISQTTNYDLPFIETLECHSTYNDKRLSHISKEVGQWSDFHFLSLDLFHSGHLSQRAEFYLSVPCKAGSLIPGLIRWLVWFICHISLSLIVEGHVRTDAYCNCKCGL